MSCKGRKVLSFPETKTERNVRSCIVYHTDDSATNILMKSSSVQSVKKSTSEELAFYDGTLLIRSPADYKNLAAFNSGVY